MSTNDQQLERFKRWQTVLIQEFTRVVSLFLAMSVGAVGFLMNVLIKDPNFLKHSTDAFTFQFGFLLICVSIAFGIAVTINRLADFRGTLLLVRKQIDSGNINEIEEQRLKNKQMGKTTWNFFVIQLSTFGFGFLLIAIYFTSRFVFCL